MIERIWRASEAFWESLTTIEWRLVGIAALCHLLKLACTSRAWRNVLAAAYPAERVRWRSIFAGYVAGVGVNAIAPARGGDIVRVALVKRAIPNSSITTIVSTTLVLTIVDSTLALVLFMWALTQDVLPSLDVLPNLPTFDYSWLFEHGRWSVAAGVVVGFAALIGAVWVARRWREFKARVAQAFAVLRPRSRYLRTVVPWQLADWSLRLATIWFFLGAFDIEQSVRNVLLVQVTASLATLVPATPGGIGTEQAFIVYVFRFADIARSTLLAFSVGMKIMTTTLNVIVGFGVILLTLGTLRPRRALRNDDPETDPS